MSLLSVRDLAVTIGAAPAADEAATETPAKSPDKGRRGGPKPL